jgi:hypothetical protein
VRKIASGHPGGRDNAHIEPERRIVGSVGIPMTESKFITEEF